MNAHAFSAQWLMEKAAADIAAVESRWGAVVGVHLAPDDLVAFDSMIATVRPGASRDAVLADIVQALLEGAQAWLARGVS